MLKPEIRILGFDDGPFISRTKGAVPVVGVIYRGGNYPDGFLKTEVEIDGTDATEKIIKLINTSRHKQQLKVLIFDGVTLGGFNVIDAIEINKKTGLPVVIINRKKPNLKKVKLALENFLDADTRWSKILNAGKIKEFKLGNGQKVYYQSTGMNREDAEEVIRMSTTHSFIPEPLRVAHMIATAVVKGESEGRA